MAITIVPYAIAPALTGVNFEFTISGDGAATSLIFDLRTAPIQSSIKEFAAKITGIFSVTASGGLVISASSITNHQLNLTFSVAPANLTSYTITIAFLVDPT